MSEPATCPKCGASNLPRQTIVEVQRDGSIFCACCGKVSRPNPVGVLERGLPYFAPVYDY